jgi:hypothetical protein
VELPVRANQPAPARGSGHGSDAARRTPEPSRSPAWTRPATSEREQVVDLQRAIGNTATSRLVERDDVDPGVPRPSGSTAGGPLDRTPGRVGATPLGQEMAARLGVSLPGAGSDTDTVTPAVGRVVVPLQRARGKAGKEPAEGDAEPVRAVHERLLEQGPLFSAEQIQEIEGAEDGSELRRETGTVASADQYLKDSNYKDWLQLPPGRRLLIATRAWATRGADPRGRIRDTPAYILARSVMLKSSQDEQLKEQLGTERNTQIRDSFVDTLDAGPLQAGAKNTEKIAKAEIGRYNALNTRANTLLRRLFLILQQGITVSQNEAKQTIGKEWGGYEGDAARALAHGGRVNVLIEIPRTTEERAYQLPEWLELTKEDRRSFSSHNVTGATKEQLEEHGGSSAMLKKLALGARQKEYGVNVAAKGMGKLDFNGDVILPNGVNGHVFLLYKPPTEAKIGILQIGMETTQPERKRDAIRDFASGTLHLPKLLLPKEDPNRPASPVGYRHTAKSTEKTANPESSFYGTKDDKIGKGKLDTMRVELDGDWLDTLKQQETVLDQKIKDAGENEADLRKIFQALVGPKSGFDRFIEGTGATEAAGAESDDDDMAIRPIPA